MATDLGRRFPPTIIENPPHMSPEDTPIYRRWARLGLVNALWQYFDVGLGEIKIPEGVTDPALIKDWIRINQKRADAVIEYKDRVIIVEFRHNATLNAVGRILGYEMLWNENPVISKPLKLLIVTNKFDAAVKKLANSKGILYQVV